MRFLANPLVAALGWTLIHFLWQGVLVGLGTALLLHLLRRASAQVRHLAACLGLLACLICPSITLTQLWPAPDAPSVQVLNAPFDTPSLRLPVVAAKAPRRSLAGMLRPALPWVVGAWFLGALFLLLRLGSGWIWLRRLRRQASVPASIQWQQRLGTLARRMGLVRCPELRACQAVDGPMAHGWWKPAVLLPASLLTGMAPELLEALLAHELAHIQRQDYLANLMQCLAETLLFYHPAVWWISARIRTTREEACDDLAAMAIGEPRRLALALAELDLFQLPAPALGAHQGDLMTRIKRLLNPTPPRPFLAGLAPMLLAASLLTPMMASPVPPVEKTSLTIIRRPAELIAQLDALAAKEGIDPDLLRAVAEVESQFNPKAVSRLGSTGLLQVMPETAQKYGARDLQDPSQVMAAGARYLRSLLDRYQGDWNKAVAAYNGGEEALDAGRLSEETLRYVPQVLFMARNKSVQPVHQAGAASSTPPPSSSHQPVQANPQAPRIVHLSRHNNLLTLDFDLTRSELTAILAENWNWLFTDGAEDRELTRSLPPLSPDKESGLTAHLKQINPKEFLESLGKEGWTPTPLSNAWLKQLPPGTATGEMKALPNGEWDVRMHVVALGGFQAEFRVEGQPKPFASLQIGEKTPEKTILRAESRPRIHTEPIAAKHITIRIAEQRTGRWGETDVDLSGTEASFHIVMDDTVGRTAPRAPISTESLPTNQPLAKLETHGILAPATPPEPLGLRSREVRNALDREKPLPSQSWTILRTVPIAYPTKAFAKSLQGDVTLQVTVDEKGFPSGVKPREGMEIFSSACIESVKQWQFETPAAYGLKAPVTFLMAFRFEAKPNSPSNLLERVPSWGTTGRYASIDFIINANTMRGRNH